MSTNTNISYFMNHDFTIESIILSCIVKAGTGALIHQNRPSYGLALFLNRERTFIFEDIQKLTVSKNTIVFFPKGSNYIITDILPAASADMIDCYAINFDMPSPVFFEPFAFSIKNPALYLEAFKKSELAWRHKNAAYSSQIKSELYNIIYNMQAEYHDSLQCTSRIQPAVDYICTHYHTETISISFLAHLCNMSSAHLRNGFISRFGMSTIQYINNLKLTRAMELLSSQMYTVTDVCFLAGFHDECYFSRLFKKHFHIPPSSILTNK